MRAQPAKSVIPRWLQNIREYHADRAQPPPPTRVGAHYGQAIGAVETTQVGLCAVVSAESIPG
jgi:hypothetical protein